MELRLRRGFLVLAFSRGIRHNVMWNAQALGSKGLPGSLPFLSCPSVRGPPPQPSSKNLQNPKGVKQKRIFEDSAAPHGQDSRQGELEFSTSAEILEAACNESIPGLTGVSNFTVFLYCKLFEGENGSVNPAVTPMGLDLHAACSDAEWYLSAAEEDFFWVHVCSEYFAHEFNNTVCANASFWLQRVQQVKQ